MVLSRFPIRFDKAIDRGARVGPRLGLERPLKLATILADERLLITLAVGTWLLARAEPSRRRSSSAAT